MSVTLTVVLSHIGVARALEGPSVDSARVLNSLFMLDATTSKDQQAIKPDVIHEAVAKKANTGPVIQLASTVTNSASPSLAPSPLSGKATKALEDTLDALRADDYRAVARHRKRLKDPINKDIITWLLARSGSDTVSAEEIAHVIRNFKGWPAQNDLRIKLERALGRGGQSSQSILTYLNEFPPVSELGAIVLAEAKLSAGQTNDAVSTARKIWRERNLDERLEKRLLKTFSKRLRKSDHKYRMDRLLYKERTNSAMRAAKYLSKGEQKLAAARQAVARRDNSAAKKLSSVRQKQKADPGYQFSLIQHHRRARNVEQAAQLMLKAPRNPEKLIDPDEWWIERRLVSRAILDRGHPQTAYRIASEHAAQKPSLFAEAEFHAGWYALRYLNDPKTAEKHFDRIAEMGTTDRTISRAYYWKGRARAAAGDTPAANEAYQVAARYKTVFYGQLAATELGIRNLALPPSAKANTIDQENFNRRTLVAAIKRMLDAGHGHRNLTVYRHLALNLSSPGEINLLADLATKQGEHAAALHVGRVADDRGIGVERLAFPTGAIPRDTRMYKSVDRALVYSIARQESAFNPKAVSRAGARGLLQLMPNTAKATARSIGLPYRLGRLTSDPAYNASLGSAHLSALLAEYNGSFVMTFAGYNAGGSRVRDWIERYGDPRTMTPHQVIDWIERIPFTETRGYVQKIIENIQVYRAQLGRETLKINDDLTRG